MKRCFYLGLALWMIVGVLHAQVSFNDLPAEYRKNGFPLLVEQCKDVFEGAYMAENKLSTHYDIPNWEGYPVELWEYYTGVDIKKNVVLS